jgi:hypothetical protein
MDDQPLRPSFPVPMRNAMSLTRRNPARFLAVSLGIALAFLSTTARARETALTAILSGLEQVRKLQPMDNRKQYELEVSGSRVTAFPDDFLRRRTPAEILKSGLSCGCGDYAFAFYSLVESKGFEAIYIDAVALNYSAVENGDSGHTGVAVKDPDSGNWILVDPTYDKIVSGDWDPASALYESPAGRFWIGYKGPLDKYPVTGHPGLRAFYAETLKSVPKDVWEKALLAFDFTVDDSLKTKDGGYSNPNTEAFLTRPARTFAALGIHPSRTVKVTLKFSGKKTGGDEMVPEADGSWTCLVQEHSRMSAGLTDWIMARILRGTDRR